MGHLGCHLDHSGARFGHVVALPGCRTQIQFIAPNHCTVGAMIWSCSRSPGRAPTWPKRAPKSWRLREKRRWLGPKFYFRSQYVLLSVHSIHSSFPGVNIFGHTIRVPFRAPDGASFRAPDGASFRVSLRAMMITIIRFGSLRSCRSPSRKRDLGLARNGNCGLAGFRA